ERSRQHSRLAQNLEAIADAQHHPSTRRKLANRLHHRRKLGNRSRPQIVAIGEAAGYDDGITVFKIVRFVPEKRNRLLGYVLDGPKRIVVAIRPRKYDNAEFHAFLGDTLTCKFSMGKTSAWLCGTPDVSSALKHLVRASGCRGRQWRKRSHVRTRLPCDKKSCHQKHRLHREQTLTASIDRARGPYANPGSSK